MNNAFNDLSRAVELEALEEEDCFEISFHTTDGETIRVRLCPGTAADLAYAILEQVEPEVEA